MSKSKQIFIGSAAVAAIALSSCAAIPAIRIPGVGQIGGSAQSQTATNVAAAKQIKVTTGSIENHIVATGQVTARQSATLAFTKAGTITKINVKEGDQVKVGQVLATIDTTDLELTAKQQWDSYLLAQSVYSQTVQGPTAADLKSARAGVSAAVATYNNLNVAPSDNSLASLRAALDNAAADTKVKQAAYDRAYGKNPGGISASSESLALEQSTNNFNAAKANYDKAFEKPAAPQYASAQANITAAQAKVDALKPTQAATEQAKLKVDQAYDVWMQADKAAKGGALIAPFDGMVVSVAANVGDSASTSTAIMTLADFATPQFVVNVDEADLGNIKLGEDATVALQSYSGVHLPAKVFAIAHSGTSTGNVITFKVTLDLVKADKQPNILLGMSGTSQVITAKADNAIVIPASLLVGDAKSKGFSVNILGADGTSQSVSVKIGLRNSDTVQIVDGLKEGDTLLSVTRAAPVQQPGGGRPGG